MLKMFTFSTSCGKKGTKSEIFFLQSLFQNKYPILILLNLLLLLITNEFVGLHVYVIQSPKDIKHFLVYFD